MRESGNGVTMNNMHNTALTGEQNTDLQFYQVETVLSDEGEPY